MASAHALPSSMAETGGRSVGDIETTSSTSRTRSGSNGGEGFTSGLQGLAGPSASVAHMNLKTIACTHVVCDVNNNRSQPGCTTQPSRGPYLPAATWAPHSVVPVPLNATLHATLHLSAHPSSLLQQHGSNMAPVQPPAEEQHGSRTWLPYMAPVQPPAEEPRSAIAVSTSASATQGTVTGAITRIAVSDGVTTHGPTDVEDPVNNACPKQHCHSHTTGSSQRCHPKGSWPVISIQHITGTGAALHGKVAPKRRTVGGGGAPHRGCRSRDTHRAYWDVCCACWQLRPPTRSSSRLLLLAAAVSVAVGPLMLVALLSPHGFLPDGRSTAEQRNWGQAGPAWASDEAETAETAGLMGPLGNDHNPLAQTPHTVRLTGSGLLNHRRQQQPVRQQHVPSPPQPQRRHKTGPPLLVVFADFQAPAVTLESALDLRRWEHLPLGMPALHENAAGAFFRLTHTAAAAAAAAEALQTFRRAVRRSSARDSHSSFGDADGLAWPWEGRVAAAATGLGLCPTSGSRVKVLIAVISRCCDEESRRKRDAIRESWGSQLRAHLGSCMELMFVLAQPPLRQAAEAAALLEREVDDWSAVRGARAPQRPSPPCVAADAPPGASASSGGSGNGVGDLVFVPGLDTYRNLPSKVLRMLQLALSSSQNYTHIVKCDDDVYVRPHRLLYDVVLAHRTAHARSRTLLEWQPNDLDMDQSTEAAAAAGSDAKPPLEVASTSVETLPGLPAGADGDVTAMVSAASTVDGTAGNWAAAEGGRPAAHAASVVPASIREGLAHLAPQASASAVEGAVTAGEAAGAVAPTAGAEAEAAGGECLFCGGVSGWFSHAGDGFYPVRDPASKWYLSPAELSDADAPLGVPYPVGWSYVMSRDVAGLALAKAVQYSQQPSLAPPWWGRLPWEDVTLGALLRDEVPLVNHAGFKHPFMACGAGTVAKHLDNLAPELQRTLFTAELAGAWSQGGGGSGAGGAVRAADCTRGAFQADNFTDWRRWRNEQPDVLVTGRI